MVQNGREAWLWFLIRLHLDLVIFGHKDFEVAENYKVMDRKTENDEFFEQEFRGIYNDEN